MKKMWIASLLIIGGIPVALADYIPPVRTTTIENCRYWSLDNDGRGYVCSLLPRREEMPEARSIDTIVQSLNNRIDDLEEQNEGLEQRLRALEKAIQN